MLCVCIIRMIHGKYASRSGDDDDDDHRNVHHSYSHQQARAQR